MGESLVSNAQDQTPLYQDKRFVVTPSRLRTKIAYYPITETVGRIRKDILFACVCFAVMIGLALWRYYDLWFFHERVVMAGAFLAALIVGTQVSILQIDARGYPSCTLVARTKTIRAIFNAITEAKAVSTQTHGGYMDAENGAEQEVEE